jgi:DNA repair protein RadA/Sms
VVDSIQTLWADARGCARTVNQVRAATRSLVRYAKAQGAALVLVGHVTGTGDCRPKVIEHMVDTVLYFEGDRGHAFHLRGQEPVRRHHGDQLFEMASGPAGRQPLRLFLGDRLASTPGSAVFANVLVEIRRLFPSGSARRAGPWSVGFNRLSMLLAVIVRADIQLCPARRLSQRRGG